ncbi:beta-1,3-galactosyltransferase 5 [Drosophila teissieri]|uniref:beta-1,3-galactosyltransferase 5 n=1 Tax=Drosophila teissieri TaxID=7243 RepID=UPI001CBA2614|nr:beta-1,3-galactosyltransferase 5 [Drosophila teissieri]
MASRLLRCILILILVSITVITYVSKVGIMENVDYFAKSPEKQLVDKAIRLRSFQESIEDGGFAVQILGNSSGSKNDMHTTFDENLNVADSIALIRNRRIDKDELLDDGPMQKLLSEMLLDSKNMVARKAVPLFSIDTEIPVRMPIVKTIYQPGHLDSEIDMERICPREGLFTKLLVLITSSLRHSAARMSIRQTWMHYGSRRDVGMAFVLGKSKNKTLNKVIDQEDFMYQDLIRGHFIDSYNNLTLKTISLLEWADLHCPKAKYLLKTDDDMFINVPKLLTLMDTLKANRSIYGRRAENWKPIRNRWSKYHISNAQYGKNTFPYFTTGPAYLLTGDIVHALYAQSLNTAFLKLEDVFTTGIVAESLDIRRVNVREMANSRTKFEACNIRGKITIHMVRNSEQFDLWKMLLDDTIKCDHK